MAQLDSSYILSSKRSRSHEGKKPASKLLRTSSVKGKPVSVQHCDELRSILLQKAGYDTSTMDLTNAQNVLMSEYSPRVVHLLDSISESLRQSSDLSDIENGKSSMASVFDITHSDEDDAVVPSFDVHDSPCIHHIKTGEVIHQVPELQIKTICCPLEDKKPIETPGPQQTAYKNDTEIAISRIFDLGKVSGVVDTSVAADAPYFGPSVITMTGFGELGRFGNQVLQYIFLKCYAARHEIEEIQVPGWVGAGLFGLKDQPVKRAFPAAVEFRDTLANSTFTTDFIDYVKSSNGKHVVPEVFPGALCENSNGAMSGLKNVDIWGWFQWHTSHFAPFKKLIQETFLPIPDLYNALHTEFNQKLRFRGGIKRTVVGLHLRLGDYKNISASSFGYVAPTSWYLSWLEKIWPTLENPVLLVASDDVEAVLRDFSAYNPVTADSIGLEIPENMKGLKAGFFPDWFSLTQCDVLAISNSTFSFTACMMNQRPGARFFRAHYSGSMERIEPWNADPIVHRDMNKVGLQSALETLQIVYNTQGSRGLAKNLLYELPYYGLRSAIMKAVLWRQSKNPKSISA